MTNKQKLSHIN